MLAGGKQKKDLRPPCTLGCTCFVAIFLSFLLFWPFAYNFLYDIAPVAYIAQLRQNAEVNHQQTIWDETGIDNYKIVVVEERAGYREISGIVVRNGIMVSSNSYQEQNYSDLTIDGLFNHARECLRFCNVTYNSQYGYPERIVSGFIEGSIIQVVAFYPWKKP